MAVVGCIAAGLLVLFGTIAFVHVAVKVDKDSLEVRCGHIGLPRRRIPLSQIVGAEFVARVTPRQWGGWGYRWRPEQGTAVVVRRGEGWCCASGTGTRSRSRWTTRRPRSASSGTGCGRRGGGPGALTPGRSARLPGFRGCPAPP